MKYEQFIQQLAERSPAELGLSKRQQQRVIAQLRSGRPPLWIKRLEKPAWKEVIGSLPSAPSSAN